MDVKSAFLNGLLDEEVYIEQPEGYVVQGHEGKVLRLKKALYGLKQVPRTWNSRIDEYFQDRDFNKCPHEHALYVKKNKKGDILIVCLYVDDLIFIGNCMKMFDDFKKEMAKEFEMIDIDLMSYYLGIKIKQIDDGIFISQEAYAKKVLKRFNMKICNPISVSIEIYVDNKSAKAFSKNPIFHDKGKYILIRYHFIHESIAKKEVQIKFVESEEKIADIFTKPLNREVFKKLRS
ncbi:hypothetical protein RJ639_041356 [Escallonia herrerae]|uniref:Reverse transcriptase Ty1/copia-type domain-containing protein n=1 Tax=Escallonia herrerae TaxID=1293975 RepID=A0AA88WGX1_9ASTE|nr:hypothetical protein RJ639_041356 [Escallonia herrerae]